MLNRHLFFLASIGLVLSVLSETPALALTPTTTNLSQLSTSMLDDMISTGAAGSDYRSISSGVSLGPTGMDLGIDAIGFTPPASFNNAVTLLTATSALPTLFPIPRFSLRKGLPFNINVGLSFLPQISYQGNYFQIWGGEVMWTFLNKPLTPALALRFTANYSQLWFLEGHSYRFEFVGSKNLGVIEPFLTFGYQFWNGSMDLPITVSTALPTYNLTSTAFGSNLAMGAGVQMKLLFMKLSAEYNYYFTGSGIQTFGGRIALLSF